MSSFEFAYPEVLFILYQLSCYPYAVAGVLMLGQDPQVDQEIRMELDRIYFET